MKYSLGLAAAAISLAQAQDHYQQVGNDVGKFYSSVGNVLANPNADADSLSQAAQQADIAIASFKNDIRTMDWSDLGADGAKHQSANLELYVSGLDSANAELHTIASRAAVQQQQNNAVNQAQAQPQQRVYQVNNRINAVITGIPKAHNKAVNKDDPSATITSSSEPTSDSASSSLESKESERESKSSAKEEKSEYNQSKKEEKSATKSESKSNKTSTGGGKSDNSTATSTGGSSSTKHSKNNALVVTGGISGGALLCAVLAFI